MQHTSRRLVSTATKLNASNSISPSSLSFFPPKEALKPPADSFEKDAFLPTDWAAVQPTPSTALNAFAHRIGLASIFKDTDVIRQACTHESYLPLFRKHHPGKALPKTNKQLAALGNSLMGMFATEWVNGRYPHLPTRVMKSVVTAHVGPPTCESVAREMGASPLLRWHRTPASETEPPVLHADAMASIPRSLTALIYQERSLHVARKFVHAYFISRQVDLRSMLKFTNPKTTLIELTKKFGRETPKSRLLSETGRFSNSPVFVVGIYSGADKLGEGFGASLKMAEYRAAEDSLHRVYLTRRPDDMLQLPTSTFPTGLGDIFQKGPEADYTAPEPVPDSEVLYYSADRSARR
ncbi:ribonuclease III domain-containing protein [Crepidotus variabilis]|uniref:Large ribosomal subunit protein mL44 n=1 Tax=Crepidotus variabilis TaxID=179855 RepID=A0A9P6EBE0_9AGAR|nr:ribonuclease III domain-containing protein [Crepidotus variabilis]